MEKARILVVEDERIIAEDIRMTLEDAGHDVVAIESSGDRVLERAREHLPELVLMDIMLAGGADGIEAAEMVRRECRLPVIYLTSHADPATLARARTSGPFGYLLKPFNPSEMLIAIEMALYKHRMEEERERLIRELEEALARVKTLEGLLPVCAWCKKVRDDDGYFRDLWAYVERHTKAQFSHGICPDCAKKNFPKLQGDG